MPSLPHNEIDSTLLPNMQWDIRLFSTASMDVASSLQVSSSAGASPSRFPGEVLIAQLIGFHAEFLHEQRGKEP